MVNPGALRRRERQRERQRERRELQQGQQRERRRERRELQRERQRELQQERQQEQQRERRRERRRAQRRRQREREAKQNIPHRRSKHRARKSKTNTRHQAPLVNNWATYTSTPGLLSFASYTPEDQQLRVQGAAVKTEGYRSPVVKIEESEDEVHLTDIPQFKNPVLVSKPAPVLPMKRTFQDFLAEHPEVQFEGLQPAALDYSAQHMLNATEEVVLVFLRKWCPNMDLTGVLNEENPDRSRRLFFVPSMAMSGIRATGAMLVKLYRECRAVRAKHSHPSPSGLVEVADHCIMVCHYIKDEKAADLINEVKKLVQWQSIGIDSKKMDILREAAQEWKRIDRYPPHAIKDREETILKRVLSDYDLQQTRFAATLYEQVVPLVLHAYPTAPRNDGPSVNSQGPKGSDSAGVIVLSDSD
ncbi:hypothetical protein F5Y06DRAFT_232357 [Hypoxylon sp. FL0890]|nr:hypothetical protein F5Y06DRAFT_232357 [Hypoxylon sp. FL0890]